MKKLIKFQCEICGTLFDNEITARECESKGTEEILAQAGSKVLFRDDWNGGMGKCYDELVITEIKNCGHYISYNLGSENGYPCESVSGNADFKDKCQIIK